MQPLYRLQISAADALRHYPPRNSHPLKRRLFEWAYPDGPEGDALLEVTQWDASVSANTVTLGACAVERRGDPFDYLPTSLDTPGLDWHLNFADGNVFFGYGSGLFAQDEIQVAEHPVLASVREMLAARQWSTLTLGERGPTPILISSVPRRLAINTAPTELAPGGLYGNRFSSASDAALKLAVVTVKPQTLSHIIAMAAPNGGRGAYLFDEVKLIFLTAYTGFAAARDETLRALGVTAQAIIHTGFWGCGAFGGNRKLMIALQILAARAADVARLVLYCGDSAGVADAASGTEVADRIAVNCGPASTVAALVDSVARLGLQWGFSDGN